MTQGDNTPGNQGITGEVRRNSSKTVKVRESDSVLQMS